MSLVPARARRHATKIAAVLAVVLLALSLAGSSPATATDGQGGNPTSWISGVGDDVNPCSRTAPCKTFYGAFSKTAQPGGVIGVLDPGNFAYQVLWTINGGITVNGIPGTTIGVSSGDGIDIAAAPNDIVILRHIEIDGHGVGVNGINFISGKALYIEDSAIEGFTADAVHVAPTAGGQVVLDNVTIANNGQNGVNASGGSATALALVTVNNSHIQANGGAGVLAADNSDVTVDNTTLTGNGQGLACVTQAAGSCRLSAATDVIDQNTTGVLSGRGVPAATGGTKVFITGNDIFGNTAGLSPTAAAHGQIISYGDNVVTDNTTDGKPSSTVTKV